MDGNVGELGGEVGAAQHQASTAHIATSDESFGKQQPIAHNFQQRARVFFGRDAAEQNVAAVAAGVVVEEARSAHQRIPIGAVFFVNRDLGDRAQLSGANTSGNRNQSGSGDDHHGRRNSRGRLGEGFGIGHFASKIEAADESVDLADGRGPGPQAHGEVEFRFRPHQHFRPAAVGVGGRKQEDAGEAFYGQSDFMLANARERSRRPTGMAATVWKGYVNFGLVSFPVRLFAAARPKSIRFHMLHKSDLSRIKEVFYCTEEDKPVSRDEIVKGAEVNKGEYIVVTPEELKAVAPPTASTMEILQFVPASEVDPLYLESSYYVAPEEAVSKPYVLLLQAMSDTRRQAVAKIAMHGREHIVILRPSQGMLVLHTMYFEDELQRSNAPSISAAKQSSPKEIELAKTLISKLSGPFKPGRYRDEYRANIERLIEEKERGHKVTAVKQPKQRPVVNIMEALQRSLEHSRQTAKPKPARKATRKKSKAA